MCGLLFAAVWLLPASISACSLLYTFLVDLCAHACKRLLYILVPISLPVTALSKGMHNTLLIMQYQAWAAYEHEHSNKSLKAASQLQAAESSSHAQQHCATQSSSAA